MPYPPPHGERRHLGQPTDTLTRNISKEAVLALGPNNISHFALSTKRRPRAMWVCQASPASRLPLLLPPRREKMSQKKMWCS